MFRFASYVLSTALRSGTKIRGGLPCLIAGRSFSSGQVKFAKIFVDTENVYAHKVLEDRGLYDLTKPYKQSVSLNFENLAEKISSPLFQFTNTTNLLNDYYDLIFYSEKEVCDIAEDRFDHFVDVFSTNCYNFNDNELEIALRTLAILPQNRAVYSKNFAEMWTALDTVCSMRLPKWDIERILRVSDHWNGLNLGKTSSFVWESFRRVGRKVKRLTPQQLVQSMFYCNLVRKPLVEMIQYELNLIGCIDQLTIEELGVMCMGFFKTQTTIHEDNLVFKLYDRLIEKIDSVEDITLVNIIKALRFSSRLKHESYMVQLLNTLVPQIHRLSLLSCLHIALLGTEIQMCHPESLTLILEKFNREIDSARLKDFERIAFVMGLHNFQSVSGIEKELCANILIQLKNKVSEIIQYPRCFPACLHYLTLNGFSDDELLSTIFENNFIEHAFGKGSLLGREMFALDSYTRINMKDCYTGKRLDVKYIKGMGKLFSHYLPDDKGKFKLSATDKMLVDVKKTVQDLFGEAFIVHALPHYERADILVAIDRNTKSSVEIKSNIPENYSGKIITRELLLQDVKNPSSIDIFNIIIGGWNMYRRNTDHPTGLLKLKLEQSKLIGFSPIVIQWNNWRTLQPNEKPIYLRQQLGLL